MAFEDYKELDLSPEKATQEEIKQLRKKYGVSDSFEDTQKLRESLHEKQQRRLDSEISSKHVNQNLSN